MTDQDAAEGRTRKPVVTVYGLYGSGGEHVARAVARRLGLPFHHQAFSSNALEGDHPELETRDEADHLHKMVAVLAATFGSASDPGEATEALRHELIAGNRRSVADCDRIGGVVLGRNAALLMADRPRTLHVLLIGAAPDRIERAASDAGISREHAARRLEREDEVRADMSLALFGWDPRNPGHYDLVANTSRVPLDAIIDAIVAAVRDIAR